MAQVPFLLRSSMIGPTSVRVHISSFSNVAPTITLQGVAPATPTLVNTELADGLGGIYPNGDSFDSVKIYYGNATFTGLPENTIFPLTVNQGGNIRTGRATTNPLGNFAAYIYGCDRYITSGRQHNVGCMAHIADYIDNGDLPVHAAVCIDDPGYIDRVWPGNEGLDPPLVWTDEDPLPTRSEDSAYAYAKALCYLQYEGCVNCEAVGDWWYEPFHQYVKTHANSYILSSDHDATNNVETKDTFSAANITAVKKALAATIQGPQPFINDPFLAGNDLSMVFRLGPIEFIAYDRISQLAGLTKVWDDTTQSVVSGDWLTSPQIAGLLGEIDSSSPFKCLLTSAGVRHPLKQAERLDLISRGWLENALGSQQPIHSYTNTQADGDGVDSTFRTLMTKRGTSIGAIAEAYGGKIFGLHGDTHRQVENRHYFPQDVNNVELELLMCGCGTVNSADMQLLEYRFREGTSHGGTEFSWLHPNTVYSIDNADKDARNTCIRLECITENVAEPYIDIVYLDVGDPDNNPTVATELKRTRIETKKQAGNFRKTWV